MPPAASDAVLFFLRELREPPDGRRQKLGVIVGQCREVGVCRVDVRQIGKEVACDNMRQRIGIAVLLELQHALKITYSAPTTSSEADEPCRWRQLTSKTCCLYKLRCPTLGPSMSLGAGPGRGRKPSGLPDMWIDRFFAATPRRMFAGAG